VTSLIRGQHNHGTCDNQRVSSDRAQPFEHQPKALHQRLAICRVAITVAPIGTPEQRREDMRPQVAVVRRGRRITNVVVPSAEATSSVPPCASAIS
jgi:hypothetical protein